MTVVFGTPLIAPTAPVSPWGRTSMAWSGWDGSEWALTDPESGVFLTDSGVEGLGMPEHLAWVGESPATHGQYYRGFVVEPRQVFWPVYLYSDAGSDDWLERDRAFWRSLQPGMHGVWSVTTPRGGKRSLSCRFVDDGRHSFQYDPMHRGWASYGVSLIADNPFWTGEPVRRTWSQRDQVGFYNTMSATFSVAADTVTHANHGLLAGTAIRFRDLVGVAGITSGTTYYVAGSVTANSFQVAATSGGPVIDLTGVDGTGFVAYQGQAVLRVNSGSQLGSAAMTNEGDLEAWPVWTIKGPLTSVTVGVDGRTVQWNVPLTATDILVIDTDPTVQSAWLNGVDVTAQLGSADFAPIPAGHERPLSLTMAGTGSVEAAITPRFFRAW